MEEQFKHVCRHYLLNRNVPKQHIEKIVGSGKVKDWIKNNKGKIAGVLGTIASLGTAYALHQHTKPQYETLADIGVRNYHNWLREHDFPIPKGGGKITDWIKKHKKAILGSLALGAAALAAHHGSKPPSFDNVGVFDPQHGHYGFQ